MCSHVGSQYVHAASVAKGAIPRGSGLRCRPCVAPPPVGLVSNCCFKFSTFPLPFSRMSVISVREPSCVFRSLSQQCGDRCSLRSRVAVKVHVALTAKGAIPRSSGLRCLLRMAPRAFLQFYCSDFPISRMSIVSFSEQQAGGHTRQLSILFAVFHSISAILRMSIVSLSGPTHCSLFLSQRPIARRRAVTIAAGVHDEWQPMFMLPQRPRGPYPQLWAEMSSLYGAPTCQISISESFQF